jgi:hypothetical protein
MTEPQYYGYEFVTSKDGKTATVRAHGDLDGNGKESLFELTVKMTKEGPQIARGLEIVDELE